MSLDNNDDPSSHNSNGRRKKGHRVSNLFEKLSGRNAEEFLETLQQVATLAWGQAKEKVPKEVIREVDAVLDRMGLQRKQKNAEPVPAKKAKRKPRVRSAAPKKMKPPRSPAKEPPEQE